MIKRIVFLAALAVMLLLPVRVMGAGAGTEVNLFLAVDASSSMLARWRESDAMGESIHDFIQNTPDNVTRVTLITFTGNAKILSMDPVGSREERELTAGSIINKLEAEFENSPDVASVGEGMVYAAELAGGMGGPGVTSVVVVLTDAYNSELGRKDFPERREEILRYVQDDIFIHFLELEAEPDAVGADWTRADLSEIAEEIGGGYRLVNDTAGLGEAFEEINAQTAIVAPPAPEVNVLMTTQLVTEDKPVTETGMLEGADLIVQGLLVSPETQAVIGGDAEYESFVSTLFIKKDTDASYHQTFMPVSNSSYRMTMTLPDYGLYDFYICLSHAESPEVFFYEGEHQTVQVYQRITPRSVSLNETPKRLTSVGEEGTPFRISASFMMEENGETIGGQYYYLYSAVAYIRAKGESEDQSIKVMDTDGSSYFIDFLLLDDGAYEYRVEILDGEEVLASRPAEITVVGEFTTVFTVLLFILSVAALGCAFRLLLMEKHFGFIVSISDGEQPNLLTYCVRLSNLGGRFKLSKLFGENKTGIKVEPVGDESLRRELLRGLKTPGGKVSFAAASGLLTVRVKDGSDIDITYNKKFSPGDSVTIRLPGAGGKAYYVTVLYLEPEARR